MEGGQGRVFMQSLAAGNFGSILQESFENNTGTSSELSPLGYWDLVYLHPHIHPPLARDFPGKNQNSQALPIP